MSARMKGKRQKMVYGVETLTGTEETTGGRDGESRENGRGDTEYIGR